MSVPPNGKHATLRLIRPPGRARAKPVLGPLRSVLLGVIGLICRRGNRLNLDSFSGHMLRDIGIDPAGREDSSIGFWR